MGGRDTRCAEDRGRPFGGPVAPRAPGRRRSVSRAFAGRAGSPYRPYDSLRPDQPPRGGEGGRPGREGCRRAAEGVGRGRRGTGGPARLGAVRGAWAPPGAARPVAEAPVARNPLGGRARTPDEPQCIAPVRGASTSPWRPGRGRLTPTSASGRHLREPLGQGEIPRRLE